MNSNLGPRAKACVWRPPPSRRRPQYDVRAQYDPWQRRQPVPVGPRPSSSAECARVCALLHEVALHLTQPQDPIFNHHGGGMLFGRVCRRFCF